MPTSPSSLSSRPAPAPSPPPPGPSPEDAEAHRRAHLTEWQREEFERLRKLGNVAHSPRVLLYMYDTMRGAVKDVVRPMVVGEGVEAVWHTAIVVYGREYYFGTDGINCYKPETTWFGEPVRIVPLGRTSVTKAKLHEFLRELDKEEFKAETYSLLKHNCNSFSNRLSVFLCGNGIPADVLLMPTELTVKGVLQVANYICDPTRLLTSTTSTILKAV